MKNDTENISTPEKYGFILFINGMSEKSAKAIVNLQEICNDYLSGSFDLQIIDIGADRAMAVQHQVIGIPTLIKLAPGSRRTILGDLSDTEKVLQILQLEKKK